MLTPSLPKIFCLGVCLFFLYLSPAQAQDSTTFRVLSYNIWNGFDWGKDSIRHQETISWIGQKNADIIALQELCAYTPEKLEQDAKFWGHPYSILLKTQGYPVGITSKEPIELVAKVFDGLWHGMLHVRTMDMDVFVVHLSPADVEFRMREAAIITKLVREAAENGRSYIILGDFNCHSPFDADEDARKPELLARRKRGDINNNKHNNLRLGHFDYNVMAQFLALPAIDLCQQHMLAESRYSFPAPTLAGLYMKAEEVLLFKERIDYILTDPVLATSCVNATIFNGKETATFSDHYPVMAEFVRKK